MDTPNIYKDDIHTVQWQLCECVELTTMARATWRHHIHRRPVDTMIDVMFGIVLISQPLPNWPVIVQNSFTQILNLSLHILIDVFLNHTKSLRQLVHSFLLWAIHMERQRCLIMGFLIRLIGNQSLVGDHTTSVRHAYMGTRNQNRFAC